MVQKLFALLAAVSSVAAFSQIRPPSTSLHGQELKSLSLAQLGQIEVTTQSKEPTEVWNTPAAIYVLTGDDIRRSGVTRIPDALRLIPGVNVARVNGSRNWVVAIRGLGDQYSKYVLVLVDGRSIYTPLFGGVLWTVDNVMLEDIDRIEVIRGPGGTIWGSDAVNGIINIITKHPRDTQGALLSAGGGNVDQNTEDLRYGSQRGKWEYRGNAFGFVRAAEYHIEDQPDYDWSRFAQAGFRAERNANQNELMFEGYGYWGKFGDAQSLSTYVPPASTISYQSMNVSGGGLVGRWRRKFGDRADMYLQGYWWHDHRIGSNFGEDRDTVDIDFLHRFWLGDHNQFTWGLGARLSPGRITQVVPTITFSPPRQNDWIASTFLQDELRIVPDKLSLTVGSKIDWNRYTGYESQPSGRLLFTPRPTASFWASVSRAVRTPDRVDEDIQVDAFAFQPPPVFARILGNNNMRVERLIAYEGGGRALLVPRFYLDFAGFHNAYHDLIAQGPPVIVPAANPPFPPGSVLVSFQYQNAIRGNTDGGEIAPDWQAARWWRIRAGYSYLHLHLGGQQGFSDTTTVTTLHGSSPNSQAFLQSQIDIGKRVNFDQAVRYVSELPAQKVRAYVTGDARLAWHPGESWTLSVAGQNLFQPHHAEFNVNPGPMVLIKRSVYAKIVWTR
ncbi:MAG TPA: TonB-dependent receptor [Terracidiphilus sp.]|nr:TonB-dependent receptor [Terracidiphilus sp.]